MNSQQAQPPQARLRQGEIICIRGVGPHEWGDVVTRARLTDDRTVVEVLRDGSERPLVPEVDWARVDATTEAEIAAQIAEDEIEAMRDAAAYARQRKGDALRGT